MIEQSSYLPVVNPEVGFSIARAIGNVNDEPYMNEQLERLDENNPVISTWIRKYAERTEDPMGAMFCALVVYKMLESQAEANKMMEDIPLE